MTLKVSKILVYYDSPQLFIAKDEVGTKFICLNVTEEGNKEIFVGVAISDEKLENLLFGKIDLRSVYINPQLGYFLFLEFESENILNILNSSNDKLPEKSLPEEGFYLAKPLEENEQILAEVSRKDKPIIHLSISNGKSQEGIEINLLGDILKLYQGFVKHSYKKSISKKEKNERAILDIPNNYKLKAFANSKGSFKIHLESNSNFDLFRVNHIIAALKRIDNLLNDGEEEEIINRLRESKGHTVNSLKNLFEKIIDNKITLSYQWASPQNMEVISKVITTSFASKINQLLLNNQELSNEIKEFVGFVREIDADKKHWRIQTEEKDYVGKKSQVDLSGIIIGNKYKFTCEEIIDEFTVVRKEKIRYNLKYFEEINN